MERIPFTVAIKGEPVGGPSELVAGRDAWQMT